MTIRIIGAYSLSLYVKDLWLESKLLAFMPHIPALTQALDCYQTLRTRSSRASRSALSIEENRPEIKAGFLSQQSRRHDSSPYSTLENHWYGLVLLT